MMPRHMDKTSIHYTAYWSTVGECMILRNVESLVRGIDLWIVVQHGIAVLLLPIGMVR